MKKILFILSCFLFTLCSAQTFDFKKFRNFRNSAQYEMRVKKNYTEALKNYNEAIKYGNTMLPNINDDIDIAICYLNLKDTIKAITSLKASVLKGNIFIEEQTWLKNMFVNVHWQLLIKDLPKLKNEYWCNIPNKGNYYKIAELEAIDQSVRNNFENRLPIEEFNKLLKITDSINFTNLNRLVKEQNANPLCFLLFHLYGENKKYFTFYDTIYKQKIFEGEADPSGYAQWKDRQRIYVDGMKTQLYGEFNEIGSDEFNLIEDIENIDKRRSEIGLCTLEEYSLIFHMKLPQGYKPTINK
jgi:tetratricopeptide (TPR) repeat protein